MSAAVCPACGVAVVPGYVRCPKCRKPLPQTQRAVEGGTAVETSSRGPLLAGLAAAGLVGGGIIAFFALRGGDKKTVQPAPVNAPVEASAPELDNTAMPDLPAEAQTPARGPGAVDIAAELERNLKRQRLWATVEVTGARVDVRSGSCADPAMAPMLDGAAPAFKAAGLTKLRCVEQSGRVVSDRDL